MANRLRVASEWLTAKLKAFAGETVVYSRGVNSVSLVATPGKTLLQLNDGMGGTRMEWTDADLLIPAADLILSGSVTTPIRGDRVRHTLNGRTIVYEVMALRDEPPWRWSDEYRTMIRVHLKQIGVE